MAGWPDVKICSPLSLRVWWGLLDTAWQRSLSVFIKLEKLCRSKKLLISPAPTNTCIKTCLDKDTITIGNPTSVYTANVHHQEVAHLCVKLIIKDTLKSGWGPLHVHHLCFQLFPEGLKCKKHTKLTSSGWSDKISTMESTTLRPLFFNCCAITSSVPWDSVGVPWQMIKLHLIGLKKTTTFHCRVTVC